MNTMKLQSKQLAFWIKLKNSNPTLFDGTPHKLQYYELVNKDILPLKIRLDIYCQEEDYKEKGFLTLCVLIPDRKLLQMKKRLKGKNIKADEFDGRFFIARTYDSSCLISDNPKDWKPAIKWFSANTKAVLSVIRKNKSIEQ